MGAPVKPRRPIAAPPPRVRQRQRADGTWRLWWEPEQAIRSQGFATVELDADRLTWSQREAQRLNRLVEDARAGRKPRKAGGRTVAHADPGLGNLVWNGGSAGLIDWSAVPNATEAHS